MAEHRLKCWPDYWDAIDRGEKNFEVRRDDRGFQKGDTLVLERWDPKKFSYELDYATRPPKARALRRQVTYVLTGGRFGIEPGHVVMGIRPVSDSIPQEDESRE